MSDYYAAKLKRDISWTRDTATFYLVSNGSLYGVDDTGFRHQYIDGYWKRIGSSVKDWRQKIARGENATSPFSARKHELINVSDGYWMCTCVRQGLKREYEHSSKYLGYGAGYPEHPFSNGDIEAVGSQAIVKLLRKIRGMQTSFQGLVFTGELRETIRMLKHPLRGIVNTLDAFFVDVYSKNGRYKKRDRIKRSSDLWLEYSFGLDPLVHDLNDALEAYDKLYTRDEREKLSSHAIKEVVTDTGWRTSGGVYEVPTITRSVHSWALKVRYIAGMRIYANLPPRDDALMRFGLTTGYIGSALWELTPWSFLFDYLTNIGDLIDAGLTDTSNVMWTVKTVRIEGFERIDYKVDVKSFLSIYPTGTVVETPGALVLKSTYIERTAGDPLVPSFTLEVPGLGRKWLNMAALGASRIRALRSF